MVTKTDTKTDSQKSHKKNTPWSRKTKKSARAHEFGKKLKNIRTQRGLSLEKMSTDAGIAMSSLSRIENNKMSPTFDILLKLADHLGENPFELLQPDEETENTGREVSVKRASEAEWIEYRYARYNFLHNQYGRTFDSPYILVISPSSVKESELAQHKGKEFIYVLQGCLKVSFEDRDPVVLKKGDSVSFSGAIKHSYKALNGREAKILISVKGLRPSNYDDITGVRE